MTPKLVKSVIYYPTNYLVINQLKYLTLSLPAEYKFDFWVTISIDGRKCVYSGRVKTNLARVSVLWSNPVGFGGWFTPSVLHLINCLPLWPLDQVCINVRVRDGQITLKQTNPHTYQTLTHWCISLLCRGILCLFVCVRLCVCVCVFVCLFVCVFVFVCGGGGGITTM